MECYWVLRLNVMIEFDQRAVKLIKSSFLIYEKQIRTSILLKRQNVTKKSQ